MKIQSKDVHKIFSVEKRFLKKTGAPSKKKIPVRTKKNGTCRIYNEMVSIFQKNPKKLFGQKNKVKKKMIRTT
jgi:hypothetical protein